VLACKKAQIHGSSDYELAFMTKRVAALVMLGLFAGACTNESTGAAVEWQGRLLQEVKSLKQMPESLQSSLGVGRPGLDGVADRGRPFNQTDVVDQRLPMRRLLVAGRNGDTWLVAVERDGRGYSVEVFLFGGNTAQPAKTWVLLDRPSTLRDVVRQIAQREAA
jgi:hypothetical protein